MEVNMNLEEFKLKIKNKKVAVLGIGISNTPLIKYLATLDVDITAFDMAEKEKLEATLTELEGLNVSYRLGADYLTHLVGFDVIFKTPKVRFDIPELFAEKQRGALVTSEMEVFVDICPAQIFAVTGSDGKTTTTTLINKMLSESGYRCWLGGNIGTPLLSRIDEIKPEDKVVLELSSFQLHTMRQHIDIAVVTNLSPNHLDVHLSMEEYVDAKKNIFKYQNPEGRVILNFDNDVTRSFAQEISNRIVWFGRKQQVDEGVCLSGDSIVYRSLKSGCVGKIILNVKDIALPGVHNIENYMAAIAAVIDFVEVEVILNVARTFMGVEHRIEFVREIINVKYYNDSIGTSPTRTIASIRAFKEKVILIAGGYDKHIPYDDLGPVLVEKVKILILIGKTGPKILEALKKEIEVNNQGSDIEVFFCNSLEEAVARSKEKALPGDVVVMSPASASFDMYKNFEERGNHFKNIVNEMN